MPNKPDLLSRRADLVGQMRALSETAETEKRDLTPDETKHFDTLESEARAIGAQLDRIARLDAFDTPAETPERRADGPELRGYSIAKALNEGVGGGSLTGLEREWHDHLSEQRGGARGTLIPTALVLGSEQRAVTTQAPAQGSNLVATNLTSMTDRRRAPLRMAQLGVQILQNLAGDLDMPRLIEGGTAHWVAEPTDTTSSDAKFEKKGMSPKTVSGQMEMSRKLRIQANEAVDRILQNDLAYVLSQALDFAAISGDGVDKPTGLLNDPLVQAVPSLGADIGQDTSNLIKSLEIDDVYHEASFLTHPAVSHESRISRDSTGHPLPTGWMWHGRPFTTSTQVPQDQGGGNDETPIFYGAWSNCYLAFWSGIDILQNPYDSRVSSKGGLLLQAFLDCDFLTRHSEAIRYTLRAL